MVRKFKAWLSAPSREERLLGLIEKQIENQQTSLEKIAKVVEKVAEVSAAHAQVSSDYYKMVTSTVGQPSVRVMSDTDEAIREQLESLKKKHTRDEKISQTIQQWQDPMPDAGSLDEIFHDMRNDLQ